MSLLDDVSIVVTPNGYKAGELYAVVPVPTEGSEEVVNGDFATDSDWTKTGGATISGGQANIDGDGTSYVAITQTNVFTEGIRYKVTVDAVITSGLGLKIQDGANNENIGAITTTGLYEFDFIATSNSSFVIGRRTGGTAFDSSVDNVSVKEYTAADMDVTRATAATRVDEAGLVNYAEIIGSEEVDIASGSPVVPSNWTSATVDSVHFLGSTSAVSYYEDVATGMISGKTYSLKLTVSGYAGTSNAGFSSQGGTQSLGGVTSLTGDGIINILFVSDGVNLRMFSRNSITNVVFSNASVKEVTRDNVPRIDYTGGEDILGSQLVTNGDFATDSDWNKGTGWTISGGKATHTGATGNLSQDVGIGGKTIFLTFDILSIADGVCNVYDINNATTYASFSTTGTKTLYFQSVSNSIGFRSNSTNVSIDNVSVKEVTGQTTKASCPHILAEPQRTNLITESSDLSSSEWNKSFITVTSNNINSLDGTQNADLLLETINSGRHIFWDNKSASSGNYTVSIFLKKQNNRYVFFQNGVDNATVRYGIIYDFDGQVVTDTNSLGSPTNASYKVEQHINGWVRLSITQTHTSGDVYLIGGGSDAAIPNYNGSIEPVYTGNTSNGFYAWAAQLESGSFTTSYIPTSGSTVTRNQDQFTRDGIGSLINSTEGVLFVEMAVLSDDSTLKSITLSDGTGGNRVIINYSNASNRLTADVRVGAVGQAFMQTFSYTITNFLKIALKYKENDFALWVNGTEVATDTSGVTFSANTLNRLGLDNGASGELLFGKVKQLQVYKTALTDEQLIQLTGESGTDFYESYAEMASALTYTIQ